ncbi:hypothetical protein ID853_18770, partial [Xenorhabdus sp. Vera]|uniref:gp53-like domain-containing protein n=1 Tax=Xenorhabdus koppenhoeferi TaxID=351659 RepID=UPI0019B41947
GLAETKKLATEALPKSGGHISGTVVITNNSEIQFSRNSDWGLLGFKNTGDGDTDSFMYFETGDNGNEYFKWRHRLSGQNEAEDWMSLKHDNLRIKGHPVYHEDNKPTAADVGAFSQTTHMAKIPDQSYIGAFSCGHEGDWVKGVSIGTGGDVGQIWIDSSAMLHTRFLNTNGNHKQQSYTARGECYTKSEADNRFIRLNTNTKTSGYILSKAANLLDDPSSRDLGLSGFLRPNEGLEKLGALAIHVAHPQAQGSQYARGISFDYGYKDRSFNVATYAFDEDGNFKGSKKILTEDDLVSIKSTAQKSPNGWWKCSDTGIIYQWGIVQGLNDNAMGIYSFITHFPNQCVHLSAMGHLDKASWGGQMLGVHGWIINNQQFKLASDVPENDDDFQYRSIFHWFAIGY